MERNNGEGNFNDRLASACQATCSSCCKKGKIFLPEDQYQAIRSWVATNSPGELQQFESRTEAFDGFRLYDQQDICQFLDRQDLCRLHNQGVKPRECFWWPLHVYTTGSEGLEIRVSNSCCEGYKHITPDSPYVEGVIDEVKALGAELIGKFRDVYPGSYAGIALRPIAIDDSKHNKQS